MNARACAFLVALQCGSVPSPSPGEEVILGILPSEATFLGKSVGFWAGRLGTADRAKRRETVATLVNGGEKAVPVLAALLRAKNPLVQRRAAAALSRVGPPCISHVIRCLADPEWGTRYHAVCVLRNLGRDAGVAAEHVARLLWDDNPAVSTEAARALAMMHERAAPAVKRLASVLSRRNRHTRAMAAGALASIGEKAAPACRALTRALDDGEPAVRRCAADALAAIGPAAATAVNRLIRALRDPDRYVRICAASALGSIGEEAKAGLPALREACDDSSLAAEAMWAIQQITGNEAPPEETPPSPATTRSTTRGPPRTSTTVVVTRVQPGDWPMLGGSRRRNSITREKVPYRWDIRRRKNLLWSARLGNETYGSPIIANGVVYVGTGNEKPRDRKIEGRRGILMAFNARDGSFLWQDAAPRRRNGLQNLLLPVTSSSPLVEGDRLYYVTGQGQLRCLDTEGFLDGENDGPIEDEPRKSPLSADVIWELDFGATLGAFPHEAPNCSVVSVGELLMVCTSNGVDEAHTNIPAPRAPSFLGVDKWTGEVAWQVIGPSPRVLHGQWSSPAVAEVRGRTLVFFGGGDGWLYALEAATGREVWRFDGNPKEAVWRTGGDIEGVVRRNNIIACPVVHEGVVYLAMGQDPMHGQGQGRLYAIDAGGHGDVTDRRCIWEQSTVGRMIASPVIDGGLVYVADYNGEVHCLDARNGRKLWTHDVLAGIWGALFLADDKLYVGDEDGIVTVLRADRRKKVLATMDMHAPIWSVPAAAKGVLYISTARGLYAIAERR